MNLKVTMKLGSLLSLAAVIACGPSTNGNNTTPDAGTTLEPTLSSIQTNIFSVYCISCHTTASASAFGDLDLSEGNAYASLLGASGKGAPIPDTKDPGEVKASGEGYLMVTPSNPAKSFLYLKISPNLDSSYGLPMPEVNGPLSAAQLQAVSDWITAGAPNN